jgi:hypothetical protein
MADFSFGDPISSILGFIGQQQTNQANWDIAQSNNAFSASQFASRYQTTVSDLQKAGLNPMLAYGQGGGSPPTAAPVAPMGNKIASAMAAYNDRRTNDATVKNTDANTDLTNTQTNNSNLITNADVKLKDIQGSLATAQAAKALAEIPLVQQNTKTGQATETNLISQNDKIQAEISQILENIKNLGVSRNLTSAQTGLTGALAAESGARTTKTKQETTIAQPEVEKSKSWWGTNISPYINDIGKFVSSAANAKKVVGK